MDADSLSASYRLTMEHFPPFPCLHGTPAFGPSCILIRLMMSNEAQNEVTVELYFSSLFDYHPVVRVGPRMVLDSGLDN